MAITAGVALVVGGAGTQAYFGNKSSKKAARAARDAAFQLRLAKNRAIGYHKPYEASGRTGLNALTGLLTGYKSDDKGNLTQLDDKARSDLFQKSPGYQFRIDEAQKALQGSQAAKGGLLSGGAMKEMNAYTQGIASNEYGSYINQLEGLAGMGQQSATAMSNAELGAGNQIANYTQQEGMAYANKDAMMGNIIGGPLSQVGGQVLGAGIAKSMAPKGAKGSSTTTSNFFGGYSMPNTNLSAGAY
tara:strand:+ start:2262 stop:2996 length:735 start_codon:yes stop_codon:yes gene_type:complete